MDRTRQAGAWMPSLKQLERWLSGLSVVSDVAETDGEFRRLLELAGVPIERQASGDGRRSIRTAGPKTDRRQEMKIGKTAKKKKAKKPRDD